MVHAFHLAGVPPGLLQCITGKGSEIGDYMTTHPGVDCISFTGAASAFWKTVSGRFGATATYVSTGSEKRGQHVASSGCCGQAACVGMRPACSCAAASLREVYCSPKPSFFSPVMH